MTAVQKRHVRAIGYALFYLCFFTAWIVGATIGWFGWPGKGWVFFAGMEFQFLLIFVVRPWISGRDPYEV